MKYIKGFDGLRAISIIMVLLSHSGLDEKIQQIDFFKNNYNLISGTTGVNIFFCISGFLITLLLLKEKEKFGNINLKLFFARRFLRLSPPLFALIGTLIVLMVFEIIPANYFAISLSFFYVYNYVAHVNYIGELGHTWSLGVEEQFYLIWPFIIRFIHKTKSIILLSIVLLILCIIGKFVFTYSIDFKLNNIEIFKHYYFDRWFIPASYSILIGAVSAILLFRYPKIIDTFFHRNYWILLISVLLYFIQILLPITPLFIVELLLPLSVVLFLLFVYHNQHNFIVSLLNFWPIAFLGKISYGVYIYQGLYLRTGPGGSLYIQQYPLNLILVFITAILSYYLLEKPLQRFKSKFTRSLESV